MQANKTVTINGRLYDGVTGLPVSAPKPAAKAPAAPRSSAAAPSVHASAQRSQTLHRRSTKKPGVATKRPQPGKHMDIARSSTIKRFAAHPAKVASVAKQHTIMSADIAPRHHPMAKRAHMARPKPVLKTAKDVKNDAISAALAAPSKPPVTRAPKKKRLSWTRRTTIAVSIVVLLITAGIVTYIALPGVSVAIASARAGVDASYPKFVPDGFSLAQPVMFEEGSVVLEFTSNSGAGSYIIAQQNSSWDSSAVLDNVVKSAAGDNYVTTQERGLTIYSFDDTATWVNGGILYTISSSAPLSGDQIRRIATSL